MRAGKGDLELLSHNKRVGIKYAADGPKAMTFDRNSENSYDEGSYSCPLLTELNL